MRKLIKISWMLVFLCICLLGFKNGLIESIPVYFEDYGITIDDLPKFGDTLNYNKSAIENFKFVFYDYKGKCYCERYVNNNIYEKGNYENSLDTLKRYVSGRFPNGRSSMVHVEPYFEPLKNGLWIIYKNKKVIKQFYSLGVLQWTR